MMKQPKKDVLREQLALAADEIIRLRGNALAVRELIEVEIELMNRRWWHRFAWWRK